MPPKGASSPSSSSKAQPTISSFFGKRTASSSKSCTETVAEATSTSSEWQPAPLKSHHQVVNSDGEDDGVHDISEPPAKRIKTITHDGQKRAERVEQWRYAAPPPPPLGQEADGDTALTALPPSSSQRSADEDTRHQAFRKKLLGSNDPIRRRDRQRKEAARQDAPSAEHDDAEPIQVDSSEDEDESQPSTSKLQRFSRSTGSATNGKSKSKAGYKSNGIKYTPLEQQVLDLKAKNPDVLLLFEVGYKFIAYEEDAVNASKELNIACFPKNNLRVASIPVHRIHIHARRLVGSGYKVGIVRQTETRALKAASSNASTPFTRELTELYTASTWVEDLETVSSGEGSATAQNSLVAIIERTEGGNYGSDERVSIGLIAVQAATGSVVYDQFVDSSMRSELETRLAHLQPAELLLPPVESLSRPTEKLLKHLAGNSSTITDVRVRIERTDELMKYNDAFSRVSKFYEQVAAEEADEAINHHELDEQVASEGEGPSSRTPAHTTDDSQVGQAMAAVMKLPHLAIIALATCLQHLQTFNLTSMFKLTSSFTSFQARSEMLLSTGTLYNLELFTTTEGTHKGSLLWLLDKCKTVFGKRTLRKWVSRPLTDVARLRERMEAVRALFDNTRGVSSDHSSSSILNKIPELLIQQPDLEKGLARMIYARASPTEVTTVILSLNRISHQFDDGYADPSQVGTSSTLLNYCIFALPKVRHVISDAMSCLNISAARKNEKEGMFKHDKYPELQDEKDKIALVESELAEHLTELKKELKRPSLQYATVSGIDYLVEVRTGDAKKVPANWLRMSATKSMVRFHTPTITRLLKRRDQHKELLAAEASRAFNSFVSDICECSTDLRNAIAALGTLDALISLATVAALPGYVQPEIVEVQDEGGTIELEGMRHPMSEVLREGYVPNDVKLGGDGDAQGLILTGANMGGKSSTVRAIALCVILAQIGSYIPASSARLSVHDSVLTRMGASDELAKGRSTFMVEAQEASEIMRVSTNRSLVILDEIGRGTSTFDGQAIASSILTHLMTREKSKRPTLLFITHFTSLCKLAEIIPRLKNVHMSFLLQEDDKVIFLYKLANGSTSNSFGIHCASLARLPKEMLTIAQEKSKELEKSTEARIREKRVGAAVHLLREVYGDDKGVEVDKVRKAAVKLGVDLD
ncbi:unnamed protein product [Sympodiomycopsis kandeliae]